MLKTKTEGKHRATLGRTARPHHHIRCQLGFLYDALDSGELIIHHVPSKFNPANTLTASEDEDRFRRSLAMIAGLRVNDKNELIGSSAECGHLARAASEVAGVALERT